jgi:hypothetical protein
MKRFLSFRRLSVIFLALFAVLTVGTLGLERYWAGPEERCEAQGKWYDRKSRICAQPISIAEITGRPNPGERGEASAAKNRELVEIEHYLRDQKAARDAATEAERARVKAIMER